MEDWRYSPSKNYETGSSDHEEHEPFLPAQEELQGIEDQKVPEDDLAKEAIKKNPKAIFEHVVAAAQRKEAIERLYELRQEVKDEPANDGGAGQAAVPVGAVLADASSRQPGLAQVAQPSPQPSSQISQPSLPPEPEEPKSSIYRRAVVAGFVTALVLVVGFGILLLLRH